jgi:Chaperone of endosialidase
MAISSNLSEQMAKLIKTIKADVNVVRAALKAVTDLKVGNLWGISISGNAATATNATTAANANYATNTGTANYATNAGGASYANNLTTAQLTNPILGAYAPASAQPGGGVLGSFTCRATDASRGDDNMAGMTFWHDAYAIRMGIRGDGYFLVGGFSRAAYTFYSDPSGNLVAAGSVISYSDPLLKENIKPIQGALDKVRRLNGVHFDWKEGFAHTASKAGKSDIGVLADEVEKEVPEAVSRSITCGKGDSFRMVSYEKLVPLLIEAQKEQDLEVQALRAELSELRAQVNTMKAVA